MYISALNLFICIFPTEAFPVYFLEVQLNLNFCTLNLLSFRLDFSIESYLQDMILIDNKFLSNPSNLFLDGQVCTRHSAGRGNFAISREVCLA